MRKRLVIILSGLFFLNLTDYSYSQNIPVHVNFDTTLTNIPDSALIYVKNPTGYVININSVRTLTNKFYSNINSFSINPFDSAGVWIFFNSNQNISYNDFIIFENEELNYSITNFLFATAKYPDEMYSFTQGLNDEPLKTALRNFCSGNTNNNYTASRTAMFSTIDDYNNDDTIICVYTGRKVYTTGIPSVNPPQSMNTEHTYPQGFFNQNEPMRSDIHHLFPTDEEANNRRNNYDFGKVISNITWQNGGSILGNDFENQLVFEPRDQHKGNAARCLFYFLTRYENYEGYMDAKQEKVLREWNLLDIVDEREMTRNNRIQTFQNNRSPYVDHPELIDRIKSTFSVIPNILKPEISASPFYVNYDTLAVNDTSSYFVSLYNYGNGNLNISSITSSAPQYTVESFPAVIPAYDYGFIRVKFRPDQINQSYPAYLTVSNNDSTLTVNLNGYSNNTIGVTTVSNLLPSEFKLYQNYPNPFNPSTKIKFDVPEFSVSATNQISKIKLVVYNSVGIEIFTLLNENLTSGTYEVNFDAAGLPSGVYFYKLTAGKFQTSKLMMLMK